MVSGRGRRGSAAAVRRERRIQCGAVGGAGDVEVVVAHGGSLPVSGPPAHRPNGHLPTRLCTLPGWAFGLVAAGEVDTDPRTGGPGLLGDAVEQVALRAAAHHDQVAACWGEADAAAARPRLDQEPARCAQAEDRHDAFGSFACRPVAVPAGAVAVVAVVVEPQPVGGD